MAKKLREQEIKGILEGITVDLGLGLWDSKWLYGIAFIGIIIGYLVYE